MSQLCLRSLELIVFQYKEEPQSVKMQLYSTNTFTAKNSQDETIRSSSQERNKTEKSAPRKNSHGQVKTSRNCSRPKPPLPPLKEKEKQSQLEGVQDRKK